VSVTVTIDGTHGRVRLGCNYNGTIKEKRVGVTGQPGLVLQIGKTAIRLRSYKLDGKKTLFFHPKSREVNPEITRQ